MIFGIGVDIVENERIRAAHQRWGQSFLDRVYTHGELRYCFTKSDPVDSLSGRFAAKEAFIKAAGSSKAALKDIEVIVDKCGRPSLELHNSAMEFTAVNEINGSHLSISHQKRYSVAVVVLEK
ncbi:holo-ACP synthase [Candidatus Magnetominusculus xianensis]|uniref:Holo-[acyl-carrier-protein] synthase n=1 Tax=Candidatus Magnetominusculus xianensis TaxID=1748249 RepID=A0ABR5SF84_9BACT|nr:holo-ACP synthase [Candidatus Magnetominusculus xianensis]KWT82804.1 holo-[acyl-carrier-protein] synthase [Candidatus Magnetominusculus xianensis]MBF0403492.1 holo-ACP synthase [Nitrospirota bacterium]